MLFLYLFKFISLFISIYIYLLFIYLLKLFKVPGRGEAIRLAFHIGGVAFEDERLSFPEFGAQKAAGRFKNGILMYL